VPVKACSAAPHYLHRRLYGACKDKSFVLILRSLLDWDWVLRRRA